MRFQNDPDGRRLPVKLDTTTNGEYAPIALALEHREAKRIAHEAAGAHAKKLGLSRRGFLVSAAGAATTLLAMNTAYAAAGRTGGFFDVPKDAALDLQLARSAIDGKEFIFDVQGHFVNPTGAWLKRLPPGARPFAGMASDARCAPHRGPGEFDFLNCIGPDQFVKDVFMDSDTDLMVLSFVPSTREGEPLTIEEAAATARIVEQLDGTHRLLLHGRVNPNQPGDLDGMDELASRYRISAWKTYTQWGPARQPRLLHGRCARHRDDREGAQARHPQHCDPQGAVVRAALVRALDLRRHRPRREALPGHQLPHLSLGLRREPAGGAVRPGAQGRRRRAGHQPARQRHQARSQRLRGARIDLASG